MGALEISPSLSRLFNLCMRESYYPAFFKIAQVVLVFKGEDPREFSNYRPVSVSLSSSGLRTGVEGVVGGLPGTGGSGHPWAVWFQGGSLHHHGHPGHGGESEGSVGEGKCRAWGLH